MFSLKHFNRKKSIKASRNKQTTFSEQHQINNIDKVSIMSTFSGTHKASGFLYRIFLSIMLKMKRLWLWRWVI